MKARESLFPDGRSMQPACQPKPWKCQNCGWDNDADLPAFHCGGCGEDVRTSRLSRAVLLSERAEYLRVIAYLQPVALDHYAASENARRMLFCLDRYWQCEESGLYASWWTLYERYRLRATTHLEAGALHV